MSNARYNWDAHICRMVELYREGLSIPKIHEAIQNASPGFTPSLGVVYTKLRAEGCPTEPAKRAKVLSGLNIARWPSELSMRPNDGSKGQYQLTQSRGQSSLPVNATVPANAQVPTYPVLANPQVAWQQSRDETSANNAISRTSEPSQISRAGGLTPDIPNEPFPGSQLCPLPEESASTWFESDEVDGLQGQEKLWWDTADLAFGNESSGGILASTGLPPSEAPKFTPENHVQSQKECFLETPALLSKVRSKVHDGYQPVCVANDDCSPYLRDTPSPFSQLPPAAGTNFSRLTGSSHLSSRLLPWRRTSNPTRCFTPDKRNSTATTDSGYATGRNSPFGLLTEGDCPDPPSSLTEFKGLYRVPCLRLHEPRPYNADYVPQPTGRFKDTVKCPHCQYSGIHNLGFSAIQLKLEVFLAELKLDKIYNVKDLDLAGNSALHYAAAGGANYDHFKGLIEAGVDPYQLNTGGQLFLHCLRPKLKSPGCESIDTLLLLAFELNLVNLLNHFRLTRAFRWRDNEGTTAVDALALQVKDTEAKRHIFSAVQSAGHPLEVSPQFIQASTNAKPNNCEIHSLVPDSSSTTHENCSRFKNAFEQNEEAQNRATNILREASMKPEYVDPETGDNVLHALSRIRFSETRPYLRIISGIRDLVCKDAVDLNLQNRDQESPLTAFIRHRPFQGIESDETGATLSKYIDALLWKDSLRRVPNKINVNMRNRRGATALYYAAVRGRPDSVRSLIEAGANVNAILEVDGHAVSILQATRKAKAEAVHKTDNYALKVYLYDNVVSYLEHEGAMIDPTIFDERRLCPNSVRVMPM